MSIFGTLGIGKLGLLAQSRAIQVASNNISNVNTPGYTRQRAVFTSVTPTFLPEGFPLGGGVNVEDVERIVDATIDAQLQRERQGLSFDEGVEAGLSRLEGILAELGGSGISASMNRFFASIHDLAANPGDSTTRRNVVESAQALVGLLHDADRRMEQLQVDENNRIAQTVTEINAIAADIAELNIQIQQKEIAGTGAVASSLRDRRAQLLEELGERIDFTTFERQDGQIAVFVGGGFFLVDSEQAARLEVQPGAPTNPSFFDIYQNMNGQRNGPITSRITGGELGSAIYLRDERIPAYRDALDEFAFTLARRVNDVHRSGYGLEDGGLRNLFVDRTAAPGTALTAIEGAASRIAVNTAIAANPRLLAAGATSLGAGLGAAAGDNETALQLANIETENTPFFRIARDANGNEIPPPVPPAAGSGSAQTLGGFLDAVSGQLGAELQGTRRALQQSELMIAELEERRGAISGVSLDEEMANLIRYERAYQASARVIETANGLLDYLMNI